MRNTREPFVPLALSSFLKSEVAPEFVLSSLMPAVKFVSTAQVHWLVFVLVNPTQYCVEENTVLGVSKFLTVREGVFVVGSVNRSEKFPLVPELLQSANRVCLVAPSYPDTAIPTAETRAGFAAAPVLPGASLLVIFGKVIR
jgi:hypothetical protein